MNPFTVAWLEAAVDDLAQCWLDARDKDAVSRAAEEVERLLSRAPTAKAHSLPEDLWRLHVPPLTVYFVVHDEAKISGSYKRAHLRTPIGPVGGSRRTAVNIFKRKTPRKPAPCWLRGSGS